MCWGYGMDVEVGGMTIWGMRGGWGDGRDGEGMYDHMMG